MLSYILKYLLRFNEISINNYKIYIYKYIYYYYYFKKNTYIHV